MFISHGPIHDFIGMQEMQGSLTALRRKILIILVNGSIGPYRRMWSSES